MSECYICNHEITVICAQCGGELIVIDERKTELPEGTEIQVEPCDCNTKKRDQET